MLQFFPVYLLSKQQPQCMTSREVYWISSRRFSSKTLLLPPKGSFWALHGAGHAGRAQKCETLKTEIRKLTVNCPARPGRQAAREAKGRDVGKGLVRLKPYGSHLIGSAESEEHGEGRARVQQGQDSPGLIASFFLIACWRATPHISTPLSHRPFLPLEKCPPISPSPLRIPTPNFFFLHNMGPGALCYLVTGLWIHTNTSLRVPLWPRPLEWIFNIW